MKKIKLFMVCFVLLSVCTGCARVASDKNDSDERERSASRDIFAMDTYMSLTAYGSQAEKAVEKAIAEIERLDTLLSCENEASEIYILNHNGSEILSEDTANIFSRSMEIYKSTQGLFDITIYPLMVEWGFTTQNYQVPQGEKIKELLSKVDASKIEYDNKEKFIALPDGVQIDFGGIAKGYTSQRIMEIFEENGVQSGLVSLGGNVQVHGTKTDGSLWKVAIENPDKSGEYIGIVETSDQAIITSGGYERYFEQDDQTYHHILDPRTGYPAKSGLSSVSIVSSDGTMADGLSTALFVMGKEEALSYWRAHSESFDVILVEDGGEITITEGLEKYFTSEYPFTIER